MVAEDVNPASIKISHLEDGYAVHNITGLRAHIVSRIDGTGYDLTKSTLRSFDCTVFMLMKYSWAVQHTLWSDGVL
jgi:hypothetical protein